MLVTLSDAATEACGGKAGALGALLRAGVPVPDGFVVPFDVYRSSVGDLVGDSVSGDAARRAIEAQSPPTGLLDALACGLDDLGDPPVAVRSSAANEDTRDASAAGQHQSVLAVRGVDEVADGIRSCWASLYSPRAIDYHRTLTNEQSTSDPVMAVLVQRLVDAEISGIMFTPSGPDAMTEIESAWGLGPSVVEGAVNPDAYRVAKDGTVTRAIADKQTRMDRHGAQLVTRDVPTASREQATLDDATAAQLAQLGLEVAQVLGEAQDVEWTIADGRIWILQARPVTAAHSMPPSGSGTTLTSNMLTGTPGSPGTANGVTRIVRGPADFTRVQPGDILVCPYTDPAWTPLLRIAAGVVTETGGALSHAAIVAREYRIPAVLGIPNVTTHLHDGTTITIDGTAGTVTTET